MDNAPPSLLSLFLVVLYSLLQYLWALCSCHVRNMSDQYFCFDPQNAARTINTVMTAVWDNEAVWQLFRQTPGGPDRGTDLLQLYKCCKTPPGYYVDYLTCYYLPTHDAYFEYYDSTFHNMIYCR